MKVARQVSSPAQGKSEAAAKAGRRKNADASEMLWQRRTPAHPILQLQQTIGNRAVGRMLQAKLKISRPGDKYEQEADRVADAVMRMTQPGMPDTARIFRHAQPLHIQRLCQGCEEELHRQPLEAAVSERARGVRIQRMCPTCQEELHRQIGEEEEIRRQPMDEEEEETWLELEGEGKEEKETILQPKEDHGQTPEVPSHLETSIHSVRAGGRPLPDYSRAFFEPRFGYDFSHVRLHTDAQAAETAQALNARAFTVGHDIIFGAGQYAPDTVVGQRLLAHELTHVVQQTGEQAPAAMARRSFVKQRTSPQLQGKWSAGDARTLTDIGGHKISGNGGTTPAFLSDGVSVEAWAWQSKRRFEWCIRGGTAQIALWKHTRYTYKHDGADTNFLEFSVWASLFGGAKAEDEFFAMAGGAIFGWAKVRTAGVELLRPLFFISEGGKSVAEAKGIGEIEVVIPINGTITVKIPLTATKEGVLAPFSRIAPPGDNDFAGRTDTETIVDINLFAQVEAVADIESPCFPESFSEQNWAYAVGRYLVFNVREREAPRALPPATSAGPVPPKTTAAAMMEPPGDCTEKRWRELQDEVDYRCKRVSFSCKQGESCEETKSKMRRAEKCAQARERINDECFRGGDAEHRRQAQNARRAQERCNDLIKENCK